ncbi:hypothetical protein SteCoe_30126 [Stentor coeruleus]|uniref:Uncharacterized protein n=1 Tax=Stentor coeruleus TaxID=5963 RepID=A0A1R2B495_9CILI|nr:hypothetical protein SteCoe_30126 [Stentor coeruleus]
MQSNMLQVVQFSIPSSPEIIGIRQFQEPSLYYALGISILKLVARFRRHKNIASHMLNTLKNMQNEINEHYPAYINYTNYYIDLVTYIATLDHETKAFLYINDRLQINQFLFCIRNAMKALLLTLVRDKMHITPDLENDRNFKIHNTILFSALMNKLSIATKLYYYNSSPETFYPSKLGAYPFLHILFNDVDGNKLNVDSYIEVYTNDLYRLEFNNTITIEELAGNPFSYSNALPRPVIQNPILQNPINQASIQIDPTIQVNLSVSLLDDMLTEIMKNNNNTMPSHLYQMIKPFADNSIEIANMTSFNKAASQERFVVSYNCNSCYMDKETNSFPWSRCKDCKICFECRMRSLEKCMNCYRIYDDEEKSRFNRHQ